VYEIKITDDGYEVAGLEFESLREAQRYLNTLIKRSMSRGHGHWSGK
jgi:hypothetical protein